MSLPVLSAARIPLMIGLLALALTACGRRGPPEAPPDLSVSPAQRGARISAAAPAAGAGPSPARAADDEEETEDLLPAVVPNARPARSSKRGFTIPKEPFILDPLL